MESTSALLLLIEDDQEDAVRFCDRMQQMADVEIEWKDSIQSAIEWLLVKEREGVKPQQIWLDPQIRDLGRINLDRTLRKLKEFVPAADLKLITEHKPDYDIATTAKNAGVDVLKKTQGDEILSVVQDLLAKRSGGFSTLRVDQAKLEGKIATLEYRQDENRSRIDKLEEKLSGISKQLTEIQSVTQVRVKRIEARQQVAVAIVGLIATLGTAIATIILPKWIDREIEASKTAPSTVKPP